MSMSASGSRKAPCSMSTSGSATRQVRQAEYGERWGLGAARCFSIEGDFLDEDQGVRLMPVPDSFFCPISAAIMQDPVATVDGCAYEREYIECWFREKRQQRQMITSPTTGLELPSTTLMPLMALQRAIEAYLAHRPEIRIEQLAGRSFEEAAQVLQVDLLEKQAMNASVHDELRRLRESNRALLRALRKTEANCNKLMEDLCITRAHARLLEDEKAAAMKASSAEHNALAAAGATDQRGESAGCDEALPCALAPTDCSTGSKSKTIRFNRVSIEPVTDATIGVAQPQSQFEPQPQALRSRDDLRIEGKDHSVGYKTGQLGWRLLWVVAVVAALLAAQAVRFRVEARAAKSIGTRKQVLPQLSGAALKLSDAEIVDVIPEVRRKGTTDAKQAIRPLARPAGVQQKGGNQPPSSQPANAAQEQGVGEFAKLAKQQQQGGASRAGSPSRRLQQDLDTLRSGDIADKFNAVVAFWKTASSGPKGVEAVIKAGAARPLVKLLEDDEATLRDAVAATLGVLAGNGPTAKAAIIRAGAIPPLVRWLKGDSVHRNAVAALRNLAAECGQSQAAIAQAGAIAPLMKLLREGRPDLQAEAAATLGNLAGDTLEGHYEKQVAIARAGAIPQLVKLLSGDHAEVRELAVGALRMIATNNADNQVAIAQAGAIGPLVRLLKDKETKVREQAAAALGNLAFYNAETNYGNQVAIVEAGAVAPLIQMLQTGAPRVQAVAASALRNLAARNAENQASILQAGVAGPIVQLLQQWQSGAGGSSNGVLLAEAMGVLRNLAAGGTESQGMLAKAGTIPLLLDLFKAATPRLREEAAGALWSLAAKNPMVHEAIVAAGGSMESVAEQLMAGQTFA